MKKQKSCSINTLKANGGKLWFADKQSYSKHERDPFDASRCWRCKEPMRIR